MSGTDLKDCFYQFEAPQQRIVRNLLNARLTLHEATEIFGRPVAQFQQPDGAVYAGLSSLAMGDSSACEFAQCAHLGVLVQWNVVFPHELLTQNFPAPRALLSVGLVIDDLVILERLLTEASGAYLSGKAVSEGAARLGSALDAYARAPLDVNLKKTFKDLAQASFWGVDCCGTSGLVRPTPARLWILVLITVRVLRLGLVTRSLMESLLGSWVSVFLLRRRLLSLIDVSFRAARVGEPQTVIRISPASCLGLRAFLVHTPWTFLGLGLAGRRGAESVCNRCFARMAGGGGR